jgi:hypothetical protein
MNIKSYFRNLNLIAAFAICGLSSLSGCISVPEAVKLMAVNVRTNVSILHTVHAKDVRALASVVDEREDVLKNALCAVRSAFCDRLEAEVGASKTKILANYDSLAADVLSSEFQANLHMRVFPKFDELERTNFNRLVNAVKNGAMHADSPDVSGEWQTALRNLYEIRSARQNVVSLYFMNLDAALKRERFNFLTKIDQEFVPIELQISTMRSGTNAVNANLTVFKTNVDASLEMLDTDYNKIDQALADLSSDLDSGATTKRFIQSYFTGVGKATIDSLKSGLGATALSDLLNSQAPNLMSIIKVKETGLQSGITNTVASTSSQALNSLLDKANLKPQ